MVKSKFNAILILIIIKSLKNILKLPNFKKRISKDNYLNQYVF